MYAIIVHDIVVHCSLVRTLGSLGLVLFGQHVRRSAETAGKVAYQYKNKFNDIIHDFSQSKNYPPIQS